MKKAYLLLPTLFLVFIAFSASAQENVKKLIEQELEFYIENLNLDEDQRNNFAEVYMENAQHKMEMQIAKEKENERLQKTSDKGLEDEEKWEKLTEDEAQEIVMKLMKEEEREIEMKRSYNHSLLEVIGAKNYLKFQGLKKKFRQKIDEQ